MSIFSSTRKMPHFPHGTDSKRGTVLKHEEKVVVGPRVQFYKHNIEKTGKIDSQKRTYGFQKTTYSATPYPTKNTDIDTNLLIDRLKSLNESSVAMSEDSSTLSHFNMACHKPKNQRATKRTNWRGSKKMDKISFAERRKRFYEAEYTIAQGIKMSEIAIQPVPKPKKSVETPKGIRSPSNESFDAETLARKFNVKLSNCFEF